MRSTRKSPISTGAAESSSERAEFTMSALRLWASFDGDAAEVQWCLADFDTKGATYARALVLGVYSRCEQVTR